MQSKISAGSAFGRLNRLCTFCMVIVAALSLASVTLAEGEKKEGKKELSHKNWRHVHQPAVIYYVDASKGDDGNDGLSPATAWKTLKKVSSGRFKPGDSIFFKRGEIWREQLSISSSGTAGRPITLGAYGNGAPPAIKGSVLVTGFRRHDKSRAYSSVLRSIPDYVFEDMREEPLSKVESIEEVVKEAGSWYYDRSRHMLFDRTRKGDSPERHTIEATQRKYGIYGPDGADYITVEDIDISQCGSAGVYTSGNDGWTVRRCSIRNCGRWGIFISGNEKDREPALGCLVEDNFIGRVESTEKRFPHAGICALGTDALIVRRNKISSFNADGLIAHFAGRGEHGVGADSRNGEVYKNEFVGCRSGVNILVSDGWKVYRNHIHHNVGAGILVTYGSDGAEIFCNVIHDMKKSPTHYNGIDININCRGGKVFNNTVVRVAYNSFTIEDYEGLPCNGWVVRNNIFDARGNNPHDVPIQVYPKVKGLVLSNNLCLPDPKFNYVGRWMHGSKGDRKVQYKRTLKEWLEASGGKGSISADPRFFDWANADFRLKPNSPCIGAGTDVGLAQDFDGKPFPKGSPPDIGAYQSFHDK